MTQTQSAMSADVALELLKNGTRREILRILIWTTRTSVSVNDLTTAVTSFDKSTSKIALYHHHLPKLAQAGVIDWDPDNETVTYRPSEPLEDILNTLSRHFD